MSTKNHFAYSGATVLTLALASTGLLCQAKMPGAVDRKDAFALMKEARNRMQVRLGTKDTQCDSADPCLNPPPAPIQAQIDRCFSNLVNCENDARGTKLGQATRAISAAPSNLCRIQTSRKCYSALQLDGSQNYANRFIENPALKECNDKAAACYDAVK